MYNFLNLPQTITKSGSSLTYYYTATGEKVCKQLGSSKRYYAGGLEYDNNKNLVLIHHPEGVVEKSGSTFSYEYFIKDHLGNTRIAFRPNGSAKTLTQRIVYYPFGHTAEQYSSNSNQYKYNGKELQSDLSLNCYDYGRRMYDPVIGRFMTQDPKTEKIHNLSLTSYHYCNNNPVLFVDINGEDWFVNDQGFYIWSNNTSVSGFEYAGTSLPENTNRYDILTAINGKYYHKYTSNLFAQIGNYFGGDFVEHKAYSSSEESFNNMTLFMAEFYLTGAAIKRLGTAYKVFKASGSSIWKMPSWVQRGFVYEQMMGGNLVKNFPVIDKFVKGVATSIKTLNLKAVTYSKPNAVYNTLKGYINKLHNFQGATKGGIEVTKDAIKTKVLNVGIPRGATKSQVEQIYKAQEYAKRFKIMLEINVIR